MTNTESVLLMLSRWIEPAVRQMRPEFTTHDYIETLREVYPADYAHDLVRCTLQYGFPQSAALLHEAVVHRLHQSDRVEATGEKEVLDIWGNRHRTLAWRRRGRRKPSTLLKQRARRRAASPVPYPLTKPPPMTGADLRRARLALGWTKTELAQRAGVSLAAVSLWERDKRHMSWPAYEAIQEALQAARSERKRVDQEGGRPRSFGGGVQPRADVRRRGWDGNA